MIYVDSNVTIYLPYVIPFVSPSYIPVAVEIESKVEKSKLKPEQMIGIVCGAVAAFFLICGIVTMAVKKKNKKVFSDILSSGEPSENIETQTKQQTEEITVEFNNNNEGKNIDFDDWI